MATAKKIDSGIVGLRFAHETDPGTLIGSPIWYPLDPNSYSDFGATITTLVRKPISAARQNKKGVVTDVDATAGFSIDLTQDNHQDLLQGFMFADFRRKGEFVDVPSVTVTGGDDTYEITQTTGFQVGSLVFSSGFTNGANNGLKRATAIVADTSVAVAQTLVTEASPPAASKLVVVGFQGATADFNIDATGTYPAITSTAKDFTQLGLIPGEWIYIGGDSAPTEFVTDANNGFKRIWTISANRIEFDKSTSAMVNETGTGLTVQLFFGRVLKNETDQLIIRKPVQFERTLGASDTAQPTQIQSEYILGCMPNQMSLNIPTADKITTDLTYVALKSEQRTGVQGVKAGTRPALIDTDAFNTSSDFSRIKLSLVETGNESPTPLFAFVTDLKIDINNNIKPNKAVGVLGAFDLTAGTFDVSGSITAYFADVTAITAIPGNLDVTFDIIAAKNNSGFVIDMPLLSLGDGKLNIAQDEPITIPLSLNAASAAKFGADWNHTILMGFYDYLPSVAEA